MTKHNKRIPPMKASDFLTEWLSKFPADSKVATHWGETSITYEVTVPSRSQASSAINEEINKSKV